MEFLSLDTPNEPSITESTVTVYEHKGYRIYASLEIAESEQGSEAHHLLSLGIEREQT